jgi:hypothetical protein
MQEIYKDKNKVYRFRENAIVRYLLDAGPFDMNKLAIMPFKKEEREQFAQLIGYSVDGFAELSYVSKAAIKEADNVVNMRKLGGNI